MLIYELLILISIFAVLKIMHFFYKRFNIWFDKSVVIKKEPSQDPNVNDLSLEQLEYLVSVIDENIQTDYQLQILARYQLLKNGKAPKEINTLPEGFTIEYNGYNKRFYPKYHKKYLHRISKGSKIYDFQKRHEIDLQYVPSSKEDAIDVIEEYNALNLGNANITIIK